MDREEREGARGWVTHLLCEERGKETKGRRLDLSHSSQEREKREKCDAL